MVEMDCKMCLYEEINSSISKSEEIILAHLVRQRLQIALALTRQISLLSFAVLLLNNPIIILNISLLICWTVSFWVIEQKIYADYTELKDHGMKIFFRGELKDKCSI